MTIIKKIIIPELKENEEITKDNQSEIKITRNPRTRSRKSIIRISFYDYGSDGIKWYYLSKLNKSS